MAALCLPPGEVVLATVSSLSRGFQRKKPSAGRPSGSEVERQGTAAQTLSENEPTAYTSAVCTPPVLLDHKRSRSAVEKKINERESWKGKEKEGGEPSIPSQESEGWRGRTCRWGTERTISARDNKAECRGAGAQHVIPLAPGRRKRSPEHHSPSGSASGQPVPPSLSPTVWGNRGARGLRCRGNRNDSPPNDGGEQQWRSGDQAWRAAGQEAHRGRPLVLPLLERRVQDGSLLPRADEKTHDRGRRGRWRRVCRCAGAWSSAAAAGRGGGHSRGRGERLAW